MTAAHPFSTYLFPFAKRVGDNKMGLSRCPFCYRKPTHPTADQLSGQIPAQGFYMFRDELSAREYYISGLCQTCQDETFGADFDPRA